jgi:hypothetical protein
MSGEDAGLAGLFILQAILWLVWLALMAGALAIFVMHIVALVDVSKMQGWQFVWPGEPVKSSWLLGLALGFVIPLGSLVTTILWWQKVRAPRRQGLPADRPFWMSAPLPPPGPPPMPPPGWPR